MAEETKTTDNSAAQATTETELVSEEAQISKFIGPDGQLLEGWQDALVPEDLRKDLPNFWPIFDNIKGVMKTAGNQARTIGKKGITLPDEKSTEDEWNTFFDAIGRPSKSIDYEIKRPADFPQDYWDDNMANSAMELFHKIGLNKKQAKALEQFDNERVLNGIEKLREEISAEVEEAENLIKKEQGDKYDERLHLANLGIEKVTAAWPAERKARLIGKKIEGGDGQAIYEGGINDPRFASLKPILLDFMAELGEKLAEHKIITEPEITGDALGLQAKIKELESTEGYVSGKLKETDPKRHEQIRVELEALYKKLYPSAAR